MLLRCTLGAALILTFAAYGQSLGAGTQSGHLAALAARQDLCDLICFAKADGTISQSERVIILKQAKSALPASEYATFKQTLDRIAPPKTATAKHLAKTTPKKLKTRQMAKITPTKPKVEQLAKTMPTKSAPVKVECKLVIPASVNLPDGVASPVFLR
jgi:hypothetical protein